MTLHQSKRQAAVSGARDPPEKVFSQDIFLLSHCSPPRKELLSQLTHGGAILRPLSSAVGKVPGDAE
jgi:hypothetical protein